jgi:hypothetical protein
LKRLWARLKQLSTMQLTREELLMKLGAARDQSRTAWRLAVIEVAAGCTTFSYRLDRDNLFGVWQSLVAIHPIWHARKVTDPTGRRCGTGTV